MLWKKKSVFSYVHFYSLPQPAFLLCTYHLICQAFTYTSSFPLLFRSAFPSLLTVYHNLFKYCVIRSNLVCHFFQHVCLFTVPSCLASLVRSSCPLPGPVHYFLHKLSLAPCSVFCHSSQHASLPSVPYCLASLFFPSCPFLYSTYLPSFAFVPCPNSYLPFSPILACFLLSLLSLLPSLLLFYLPVLYFYIYSNSCFSMVSHFLFFFRAGFLTIRTISCGGNAKKRPTTRVALAGTLSRLEWIWCSQTKVQRVV